MQRRIFVLALVALLPVFAACSSDSSDKVTSGRPTEAQISKGLQTNGGFTEKQADCVAKSLGDLSAPLLRAIVNKETDSLSESELTNAEAALLDAFKACSISPKTTSTTTP